MESLFTFPITEDILGSFNIEFLFTIFPAKEDTILGRYLTEDTVGNLYMQPLLTTVAITDDILCSCCLQEFLLQKTF
jgi:hypothetical protein